MKTIDLINLFLFIILVLVVALLATSEANDMFFSSDVTMEQERTMFR